MEEVRQTILWVVQVAAYLVFLAGFSLAVIILWEEFHKKKLADRKKRARRAYKDAKKALEQRRNAALEVAKVAWEEYGQTVEVESDSYQPDQLTDFLESVHGVTFESPDSVRNAFTAYVMSSALNEKLYALERFVEINSRYLDESVVKDVMDTTLKNETVYMESGDDLMQLGFDLATIDKYITQIV